jgi:3-methyladenine DNA glycosylase AlkD
MESVKKSLMEFADPNKAKILQRFFKTGKGQYGEGDIFLGVSVPNTRKVAKNAPKGLSLTNIRSLLESKIHEERLAALLILVDKFEKADENNKNIIYKFYLANAKNVNNWDLVDLSAPKIVGEYLLKNKDRKILYKFARSINLWEKRISIISTFAFIRKKEFDDTLSISKILINDSHDLIHKAVGWMLREVGKRNQKILKKFLRENYSEIPRTTLRYAIERFPEDLRKKWLLGDYERLDKF